MHLSADAARAVNRMLATSMSQRMRRQHVAQEQGSDKPSTPRPLSLRIASTLQYTRHSTPEGMTAVQQASPSAKHLGDLAKHSACFDCGATVTCLGSAAAQSTLTSTEKQRVQVMTADGNATTVNTVGYATLYVANINGDLRPLPTGRALVDKRLHDLISPSAMLKDESGLYQGATLSRDGDFISLSDGDMSISAVAACRLLSPSSPPTRPVAFSLSTFCRPRRLKTRAPRSCVAASSTGSSISSTSRTEAFRILCATSSAARSLSCRPYTRRRHVPVTRTRIMARARIGTRPSRPPIWRASTIA